MSKGPIDPFIALYTGGKAYPLGLDPETIRIEDIAHSLSQQCRYAGHTSAFWSVACHSVEVSYRVEPRVTPESRSLFALAALLHDASEAYLQDIVRPIKPLVQGYSQWEANVQRAIVQRFDLMYPTPEVVAEEDSRIVLDEIAQFFPPWSEAWKRYGIMSWKVELIPLSPADGEALFLKRFYELGGK